MVSLAAVEAVAVGLSGEVGAFSVSAATVRHRRPIVLDSVLIT